MRLARELIVATTPRLFESPEDFVANSDLRPGWVLWIGAGVSAGDPAGSPLAGAAMQALLSWLGTRLESTSSRSKRLGMQAIGWLKSGGRYDLAHGSSSRRATPFEAVLGEVASHTDRLIPDYLRRLYPSRARAVPNQNHRLVLQMLNNHQCAFAVTTNFDECLEAAGMPASRVLTPGSQAFVPSLGQLVKIHGTSSRPTSMAATPHGLARRANSRPWRRSLYKALRDRDVVCVGYSLSDWFDINPVLGDAIKNGGTRLFVAGTSMTKFADAPPIEGFVRDHQYTCLSVLAVGRPLPLSSPTPQQQLASAKTALDMAEPKGGLPACNALRALAALLHRVENGEAALHLFVLAAQEAGKCVDDSLMAIALLRARRYRAAERRLQRVLDGPLVSWERIRFEAAAGHLAQAGGRPRAAEKHYLKAERVFDALGRSTAGWPPAAVDEFLRGRAERLIHQALGSWRRSQRDEYLARAEAYYRMLCEHDRTRGFPVSLHLLVPLLQARIALAHQDWALARSVLEQIEPEVLSWADPHLLVVHHRLLAAAAPARSRHLVLTALRESWDRGRWQEVGKAAANLMGFHGYGKFAPIQVVVRNTLIASLDWAKDALTCVHHRWAR